MPRRAPPIWASSSRSCIGPRGPCIRSISCIYRCRCRPPAPSASRDERYAMAAPPGVAPCCPPPPMAECSPALNCSWPWPWPPPQPGTLGPHAACPPPPPPAPLLALLVLTVGLNVLSGSTAGAFSIASSLMCMIFALGTVSGAHFNPAVTTAIVCAGRGKCTPKDGALYMIVQTLGGISAALTYSVMMSGETFALKPAAYQWSQALVAELVFTFLLAFVVLSVATVKNGLTEYFGFAIGMCVTVGGCAIGKVSGGSLNPAVSFGISTSHIIG